jgi:hypothetical protein
MWTISWRLIVWKVSKRWGGLCLVLWPTDKDLA